MTMSGGQAGLAPDTGKVALSQSLASGAAKPKSHTLFNHSRVYGGSDKVELCTAVNASHKGQASGEVSSLYGMLFTSRGEKREGIPQIMGQLHPDRIKENYDRERDRKEWQDALKLSKKFLKKMKNKFSEIGKQLIESLEQM